MCEESRFKIGYFVVIAPLPELPRRRGYPTGLRNLTLVRKRGELRQEFALIDE